MEIVDTINVELSSIRVVSYWLVTCWKWLVVISTNTMFDVSFKYSDLKIKLDDDSAILLDGKVTMVELGIPVDDKFYFKDIYYGLTIKND